MYIYINPSNHVQLAPPKPIMIFLALLELSCVFLFPKKEPHRLSVHLYCTCGTHRGGETVPPARLGLSPLAVFTCSSQFPTVCDQSTAAGQLLPSTEAEQGAGDVQFQRFRWHKPQDVFQMGPPINHL